MLISSSYKTFLRRYWDVQTQVFENNGQGELDRPTHAANSAGWIFWAWKTETGSAEWSYQAGIAGGWIPSNPTSHTNSISSLCG